MAHEEWAEFVVPPFGALRLLRVRPELDGAGCSADSKKHNRR